MTQVTLVAGAVDEQHPVVTNIARLLQTLDDDGDPANGISITPGVTELAVNKIVDFDQSVLAFEDDGVVQTVVAELTAVTSAGARTLISVDETQAFLRETLLGMYAGKYTGTFDGVSAGSLELTVDDSGNITGSGCIDSDSSSSNGGSVNSTSQCTSAQNMEISGSLKSSGEFNNVIGESAIHTVIFEGAIDRNGEIVGTWENGSLEITGTFTGHKDSESNGSSPPGDADIDTDQCIDIGTTTSSCSSSNTSVAG